jgi:hypothetical protein
VLPIGFGFGFDVRSKGAWDGPQLGLFKLSKDSLNVFKDCSSHKAGGTLASLYLLKKLSLKLFFKIQF